MVLQEPVLQELVSLGLHFHKKDSEGGRREGVHVCTSVCAHLSVGGGNLNMT